LSGGIRTTRKNTDALVVTSKDTGLEVNADKPMCMVKSRDQNAGRCHSLNTDNGSFDRVEEFSYIWDEP